jgi:hypothetical protein
MSDENESTTGARPARRGYRKVIAVNLILGLLLWAGYCTDYSLRGTMPDYMFPPAVALVALASLFRRDKGMTRRSRRRYVWSCMPSLIGGGMAMLLMAVVALMGLPALFMLGEISG